MRTAPPSFYIGWDVGGWNCDNNTRSRDAIVILDSALSIVGKPWRGNLRRSINESASTREFIDELFSLTDANEPADSERIILAIDTPLGFSGDIIRLVGGLEDVEPLESSANNPYLFRQTERYLFQHGLRPLSAVKDMIGSQATKGMHVLAKFAPQVERCGVWSDGDSLIAIEAYPAACKDSSTVASLRQETPDQLGHRDEQDALTCALVGYLFDKRPEDLASPPASVPEGEGWIWVPRDTIEGTQSTGSPHLPNDAPIGPRSTSLTSVLVGAKSTKSKRLTSTTSPRTRPAPRRGSHGRPFSNLSGPFFHLVLFRGSVVDSSLQPQKA